MPDTDTAMAGARGAVTMKMLNSTPARVDWVVHTACAVTGL